VDYIEISAYINKNPLLYIIIGSGSKKSELLLSLRMTKIKNFKYRLRDINHEY